MCSAKVVFFPAVILSLKYGIQLSRKPLNKLTIKILVGISINEMTLCYNTLLGGADLRII